MGRAERRRAERDKGKKEKVFVLTRGQIEQIKAEAIAEAKKAIAEEKNVIAVDATGTALALLLTLPLKVLVTDYWPKTAYKKGQEFTQKVLELYEKWESGEVTIEELQADLWEYGGIRLEYK